LLQLGAATQAAAAAASLESGMSFSPSRKASCTHILAVSHHGEAKTAVAGRECDAAIGLAMSSS